MERFTLKPQNTTIQTIQIFQKLKKLKFSNSISKDMQKIKSFNLFNYRSLKTNKQHSKMLKMKNEICQKYNFSNFQILNFVSIINLSQLIIFEILKCVRLFVFRDSTLSKYFQEDKIRISKT